MKSKNIFTLIAIVLIVIPFVLATYTYTLNAPNPYVVSTTASVLLNATCIAPVGDLSTNMNISIFWKTNRTGQYLNESKLGSIVNNTPANITITFEDGDRVWWKASCYDSFGEFRVINESSILPIAVVNNTYTIPLINETLSLTSGSALIINVVGVVNDSVDYRAMVVDVDYNISNNIVTNLNESLSGNTSMWSFDRYVDLINDTYNVQNVTGLVNDTGGDYRAMVVDADYSISSGMIYMINSSLNENVSLWSYNWPASVINQTNTSVRLFDVDTDYYTLSLGASKVINFSLDTGDATFLGDVIADSFTGTVVTLNGTGLSANYTMNALNDCYMSFDSGIMYDTNCTVA